MHFVTNVSGFSFICIADYEKALNQLRDITTSLDPLRASLINDIKQLEQKDKNTFAKSIRLLDRFHKEVNNLCQIHL